MLTSALFVGANAQIIPDSVYVSNSCAAIFIVDRTEIQANDSVWIKDSLIQVLKSTTSEDFIFGRAAASPEGPYKNNVRLANGRRMALNNILVKHGIDTTAIIYQTVVEDYDLLVEMMRQAKDPAYATVKAAIAVEKGNPHAIKRLLKSLDGGKRWEHMLKTYFPALRATRIWVQTRTKPLKAQIPKEPLPATAPIKVPSIELPRRQTHRSSEPEEERCRREVVSIKTNALGYGLYIPQYGYCPIPNWQVEYYPKHGHWTGALSFDNPWWIGNTSNHKYMEVRNWQIEGRYYFRNSDLSIGRNEAAFKGLYVQAYGQTGLYQIGFSAKKGWIGEGGGGGVGIGYVLPFTRHQHWRVEFSAQLGVYITRYDPFVYGDPVDHHLENDYYKDYYYDWTGDADDFKRRQYRFTWFGPTKVGISISYDLLYRKPIKGVSFRAHQKK